MKNQLTSIYDASLTVEVEGDWIDLNKAGNVMSFAHRTFAFLSSEATKVTLEGSMDKVTVHATIINAQALTADTILIKRLTEDEEVYRYYRVTLTPSVAQPDAVKAWLHGPVETSH